MSTSVPLLYTEGLLRSRVHVVRRTLQGTRRISVSTPSTRNWTGYVVAGVAGGSAVLAGGYTWYHFSSVKKAIDASKAAKDYLAQTRQSIVDHKATNQVLVYLRQASKAYVSILPGAGIYVDKVFDSVDQVVAAHSDETREIAIDTFNQIQAIIQEHDKSSLQTAFKVMSVLKKQAPRLQALSAKVGGDALTPIIERYPGWKENVTAGVAQLQEVAKAKAPDVSKLVEDGKQQVKDGALAVTNSETVGWMWSYVKDKTRGSRRHDKGQKDEKDEKDEKDS
ncbi:hypothetical protein BDQ12DRAFT_717682 [Crucibulum laeve]|uniref:Uncharacterized protein n=1 Tax=Crucibulum laeve TaxID=68775 RepID=A0A5C3MT45_9AGAR|nr:hypothetical protein BDQ12DRAFT_717682 [Crucibulum laeve]